MPFSKIKSHAKLNLALNIISKRNSLHNIESIIAFVDLHDVIFIKKIKSKKHVISFLWKYFTKKISKNSPIKSALDFKKRISKHKKMASII